MNLQQLVEPDRVHESVYADPADFAHLLQQDPLPQAHPGVARSDVPSPGMLSVPAELQREVEQFLYRQAELLDGKRWQAWFDCFDEHGVYWMPVTRDQTEWEGSRVDLFNGQAPFDYVLQILVRGDAS